MKSIYNGSDQITRGDVLNSYMMAPVEMKMEAHMFGGMYGVTDNFTLMAMVPYIEKEMTMINQAGVMNTSSSRGVGDLKITSLITLNEKMDHESKDKWLLNVGASLPTGSIEERSDTGQKLAYPMQLGSGTIDPIVRLTYTHHEQDWSWGAQGNGVFRLGTNDQGYRLGHEYGATTGRNRQVNWMDFDLMKMAIDINGVNKLVINKMDVLDEVQKWCLYSGLSVYEFDSREDMEHWLWSSLESKEVEIMFSGDKEAI